MLDNLKSKKFWEYASGRCIRTFFQTFIATIGTATVLQQVNWKIVFSASILSGILSFAMSIVMGIPETSEDKEE